MTAAATKPPVIGPPTLGRGEFIAYGTAATPDGRLGIVIAVRKWHPDRRIGSTDVSQCWSGETFANNPSGSRQASEVCRRRNASIQRPAVVASLSAGVFAELTGEDPYAFLSLDPHPGPLPALTGEGEKAADVCLGETVGTNGGEGRTTSAPSKGRASGTSRGDGAGGGLRKQTAVGSRPSGRTPEVR